MIGEGPGAGFNINVPWENGRCGDADYLAVWDHVLIPIAKDFRPDIIIISAGFDAGQSRNCNQSTSHSIINSIVFMSIFS